MREDVLTHHNDPALAAWATHFYKVTISYWRGLFPCYDMPELPRTNNDLEQYFGRARHHERRTTGHKVPTAALAVRGAVRVVAAVATRVMPLTTRELRLADRAAWHQVRCELTARQATRRAQHRFRRDPAAYLATLEMQLLQ